MLPLAPPHPMQRVNLMDCSLPLSPQWGMGDVLLSFLSWERVHS